MGATSPVSPEPAARRVQTAHALALTSIALTPVPIAVYMLLSQASYVGRVANQYLGYYGVWNVIFALGSTATVGAIVVGGMAIGGLLRYPAQIAHIAWMGVALTGIALAVLDGAAIALFIYLVYGMTCPAGC